MSGLWGIHPAAAAAGAAAVGAGVTHAYHSSGASRPRRRSNQATFVVERGKDTSARAKRLVSSDAAGATAVSETAASGARAVATGAGTAATTATFPVASRAHVRGVLYDADGEPVVIDERARFGAEALFLSSLASSALAVAVTRALAARDARRDDSTRDVASERASEASRDLEGIARGIAAAAAAGDAGPSGPSGSDVSGAPNRSPKASASFAVAGPSPATPSDAIAGGARREPSGAAPDAAPDTAPLTRELRALMEASPCQSPLDSDLDAEGDWMGSVVSSASPFATPARQALGALRDRQRAAAHAGAPFAEEAVREMERIVVRAARSAAASAKGSSACASGAATPLSRTRPALPRLATAHSAAVQEQRDVVPISALEKRDVAGVETVAVEKTEAPEKARPGEGVSGAPAPETPSPTAPTPKLPEGSGVFFTEKRGRASPSRAPSASHSSDAGSNRARSPPREPLVLLEKDNERQLRSASEATDAARDRVRVAEERYRAARERLKEASSVASRSRESSAMPTPRGGAENAEAGPCASHVESGRNHFGKTNQTVETGTGTAKRADAAAEVREMAEKARAAAARSRLASARAATTAERAARDADAEASRVREAWAHRLAQSPRAAPGEPSGQGVSRDAVPADRWASSDEVRGKTDVLDRFMDSLTDTRESSASGVGGDEHDVDVSLAGGDNGTSGRVGVSEKSSASGDVHGAGEEARDKATEAPKREAAAAKPATRLGVLSVSLLGDPREGETLTLHVDAAALPPDCGPVTLRWQRGATSAGTCGGSSPGTPRAGLGQGPSAPPAFKTILGARRASYTLTRADVGCVVRAVAAAGDTNAGGNVFGSAETRGAVTASEWA